MVPESDVLELILKHDHVQRHDQAPAAQGAGRRERAAAEGPNVPRLGARWEQQRGC